MESPVLVISVLEQDNLYKKKQIFILCYVQKINRVYNLIIEKMSITHDMYYRGARSHLARGLCTRKLTHPASSLHYRSYPLSVHWRKSLKKNRIPLCNRSLYIVRIGIDIEIILDLTLKALKYSYINQEINVSLI